MTRRRALICLGLAVLCGLAYAPSLTSPFTLYDDGLYVTENVGRLSKSLATQWDSNRAWSGDFVEYFPLRDSVYWALYHAFELNPTPYHVASLVFHVAATLLMFLLLLTLGLEERIAGFASLLFAVHPVHIESVVWIAGLKDPLYTALMLLGLWAYARYRQSPRPGWYALMLLGLVSSLLVKSLSIVMPGIMLAMELCFGKREPWKEIIARVAGPGVIAAEFLAMFVFIGKANQVLVPPHGGSWMSHVVLSVWAQAKYLKQALLPTSFRMIYCFEPPTGWGDWRLWVGLGLFAAVGALVVAWRREPVRLFFVAWYVLALLPVSNLLPFPAVMADRYLYAASIGSCALVALLITRLDPRLFRAVTIAAALGLTATTASRAWLWQDQEVLWEEPSRDPACNLDKSFPAAQSHYMYFQTAKDRLEGLLALERVLASPGIDRIGPRAICAALVAAAGETEAIGARDRAIHWAKTANRLCPTDANGWNIAMIINMHSNPRVAAMAALKSYRLSKTPEAEVLMWLTQLEINTPQAPAELQRLAEKKDPAVCQKIVQWSYDSPSFAPLFAQAVHTCLDAGLGNERLKGQRTRAYSGPAED